VLDAGCGMGKHMEVVARAGVKVIGFDLSDGVKRANSLVSKYDGVYVLQADLYYLPFRKEKFDFIYSIGVLDHTPDPEKAFYNLVTLLKKGGEVSIWVHHRFPKIKEVWFNILRFFTSRMPLRFLHYLSLITIPKGYIEIILRKFSVTKPLAILLSVMFPVSLHPDPEIRVTDTFNWHAPRYQKFFDEKKVERWFEKASLKIVKISRMPVGILGRKE